MISRMPTARPQQRYDHRLREIVQRSGDLTIATDRGSSVDGAGVAPHGADRCGQSGRGGPDRSGTPTRSPHAPTIRPEPRRAAPARTGPPARLRLTLSGERLPNGPDKLRILRAIDQARACIPLRALLRLLRLSPSRFHAWRRRHTVCALDDQSSCPRTSPHRLTSSEIRAIEDMVNGACP
jgi:putative transposase